ncbi:serine/threonine-protein kinase TBK1-like [Watersipora subatra]|uniref:serine/threonine-protein kinase TBK1-like n=1 Tax=Watersipora subatra TaxID=2589382 RepID=UPI00355BBEFD
MSGKPLKGSANYIWWEKDELGKGATATVYKCREKKTGDIFAVKVFSSRHRERQPEQDREFLLLSTLNHENIVKMLAIEEESQSDRIPSRVIVMEYCNGGSLYSILEKTSNAYGLPESEFLLFLKHIAAGLKYLREKNVVHRDIKPGNILKLETGEGRSIYKLTDFGAARKLNEEDESFTSLYGTEEYLHPDLYDRAVIRQSFGTKKSFTASVDLWSVGVTIYHVATGSLPFRPCGGRRNRPDMQRILTGKKRYVISGVCEKANGKIDYSDELPPTCNLSVGLKLQLTPLIAGLLEVDLQYCSDFETFFSQVSNIVDKTIVNIFDACQCKLLKVYCDPKDDLHRMKDLIERQCQYLPVEQLLLYENSRLDDLVQDTDVAKFPVTTEADPVMLYHCREPMTRSDDLPTKPHIPKFNRFASAYDLEKDYQLAKNCTSIMKYICNKLKLTLALQGCLDRAVKVFENYVIYMVVQLRDNILMVISTAEEVRARHGFMRSLVQNYRKREHQMRASSSSDNQVLERFEALNLKIEEMGSFIQDLQKYGEDYKEKLADKKELSHKWRRSSGCDPEKDMCAARVASLTNHVEECMTAFHSDRRLKTLPYNEEQIHKFEKNKMSECCTSAVSLHEDHCWDKTKKMYRLFIQWFQMAYRIQNKIHKLRGKMGRLQTLSSEVSKDLSQCDYDLVQIISKQPSQAVPASHPFHSYPPETQDDTGLGPSVVSENQEQALEQLLHTFELCWDDADAMVTDHELGIMSLKDSVRRYSGFDL